MSNQQALSRALQSRSASEYIARMSTLVELLLASDETRLAAEQCEELLQKSKHLRIDLEEEHRLTSSLATALLSNANYSAAIIAAHRLVELSSLDALPLRDRAFGLALASRAAVSSGDLELARQFAATSNELARSSGDALALAHAMRAEGSVARAILKLSRATAYQERAIAIYEALGHSGAAAILRNNLSTMYIRQRRFRSALAQLDGTGDRQRISGRCSAAINRAICHLLLGNLDEAQDALSHAERLARERGQSVQLAATLGLLAELSRRQGDLATAKSKIEKARAIEMPVRSREHTICIEYAGKIEADLGNRKHAIKLFREALAIEREANPKSDTVSECLRHIADNLIALGQYGQAIDYAKRCLDLSRTNYEAIEVAAALRALANAQSRLDKPEEAESLFEESIAGFRAVEEPYELAIASHDLAVHGLREDAGDVDVMARVTEAERLFERLGATTWLERTRQLRAEAMKQLSRRGEGASSGRRSPRRQPDANDTCGFITSDAGLLKELEELVLVSQVDIPVLITGERGTGKEIFAQEVHRLSKREGKLIALNCAAIPSELQEATFFGHARGSFTGAIADRQGAFELAQNGTLFLDEIGDMSLPSCSGSWKRRRSGASATRSRATCRPALSPPPITTSMNWCAAAASGPTFLIDWMDTPSTSRPSGRAGTTSIS